MLKIYKNLIHNVKWGAKRKSLSSKWTGALGVFLVAVVAAANSVAVEVKVPIEDLSNDVRHTFIQGLLIECTKGL